MMKPIMLNAANEPMTEPATAPGLALGGVSFAALLDTADAEVVAEPVMKEDESEDVVLEEVVVVLEVEKLVLVTVMLLKIVDVPVVVDVVVPFVPSSLVLMTPTKGAMERLLRETVVPFASLDPVGPVALDPSDLVLVTVSALNKVLVTVIVGEPFEP